MTKIVKLSLITATTLVSVANATPPEDRNPSVRQAIQSVTQQQAKKLEVVDDFRHIFEEAKVSGNIRAMYSRYSNDNDVNTYATALGGQIKYELAKYKGFNAGITFATTHDLGLASGNRDEGKRNDALSSTKGTYTELTEAYLNYAFEGLNLRVGRQLIDTPLADSDDIRMVLNTFEAYIASYKIDDFALMAGHLNQWQGTDAGLDNAWVTIGDNGVNFAGLTYSNDYVESNAWYYNITGADEGNNAIYLDAVGSYTFNDDVEVHAGVQYLKESELDNSGVEANIYGAMAEVIMGGLGLNIAYNKSLKEKGKTSFSGFGGGTLFTNMDTMILNEITEDRDAQAIVTGLVYEFNDFSILYAYGDFKGDANSAGDKSHIVEQNIGAEYAPNEHLIIAAILTIDENKEDATSTDFNDKNFRVLVSYNF